MIYSGSNMAVVSVASKDKNDRKLNAVRFEADGTTVAGRGRVILAVGPVKPGAKVEGLDGDSVEGPVSVEAVDKALKQMAKGKAKAEVLQYVRATVEDGTLTLTSLDERGGFTSSTSLSRSGDGFKDWRGRLRRLRSRRSVKVAVDRSDLIDLIKAIDAAANEGAGVNPLFVEVSEKGIVARAENRTTGQRIIGAVSALVAVGLGVDKWESGLFAKRAAPERRVK